jgi:conjugative relaxase-like TrwC/TraI family protein
LRRSGRICTQARIGNVHALETTGKFAAATFEHDTARPVDGYAAPQLHTHAVIFNVTERKNGQTRSVQSHELYASQHYGTAIYRAELATRLQKLGYELERGKDGQPEIKGYTREYLEASSPRRAERLLPIRLGRHYPTAMYFLRRRDHLVQNQDDTIQSWGLKDLPVLLGL